MTRKRTFGALTMAWLLTISWSGAEVSGLRNSLRLLGGQGEALVEEQRRTVLDHPA